jgi:hypothetical protein
LGFHHETDCRHISRSRPSFNREDSGYAAHHYFNKLRGSKQEWKPRIKHAHGHEVPKGRVLPEFASGFCQLTLGGRIFSAERTSIIWSANSLYPLAA